MKPIAALIILLILISLSVWGLIYGINGIDKTSVEMKSHIGDKVLLNKDTLEVVDYSLLFENYILSNNTEISKEYFNKNRINQQKQQ